MRGFFLNQYIRDFPEYMQRLVRDVETGKLRSTVDSGVNSAQGPFTGVEGIFDAVEVSERPLPDNLIDHFCVDNSIVLFCDQTHRSIVLPTVPAEAANRTTFFSHHIVSLCRGVCEESQEFSPHLILNLPTCAVSFARETTSRRQQHGGLLGEILSTLLHKVAPKELSQGFLNWGLF